MVSAAPNAAAIEALRPRRPRMRSCHEQPESMRDLFAALSLGALCEIVSTDPDAGTTFGALRELRRRRLGATRVSR